MLFYRKKPDIVDEGPSAERGFRGKSPYATVFKIIGLSVLALFVIITGFNTVYILQEDEYAVIRTFGATQVVEQPGIQFKIPCKAASPSGASAVESSAAVAASSLPSPWKAAMPMVLYVGSISAA